MITFSPKFVQMVFKILDLETEQTYFYLNKGFCALIGISEKTFNNRWRIKESLGIVVKNRWYIKQVELCQ